MRPWKYIRRIFLIIGGTAMLGYLYNGYCCLQKSGIYAVNDEQTRMVSPEESYFYQNNFDFDFDFDFNDTYLYTAENKSNINANKNQDYISVPPSLSRTEYSHTKISDEMVSASNSTEHVWLFHELEGLMEKCRKRDWGSLGPFPTLSVVITFGQFENNHNILHTANSIVLRTPPEILQEIIIVADNTSKVEHTEVLKNALTITFGDLVRIIYTSGPASAIRARHMGALQATADVIAFFDSHQEVQDQWAEPLLYEILQNPKTLAAGCLDWMEKKGDHWKYTHGAFSWAVVFDWAFNFAYQDVGISQVLDRSDPTASFISPAQMGATCAISRNFLAEIGYFDAGMDKWGGENIDLSIKAWLCGGRVVISPCARAAHLESPDLRSYRRGDASHMKRNYKRIAEVWLDELKPLFYRHNPKLTKMDAGDLSSRRAIKKNCKRTFLWYLENVFPQLGIPEIDSFAYNGVMNLGVEKCLHNTVNRVVGLRSCDLHNQQQYFYWDKALNLRFPLHIFNKGGVDEGGRTDQGLTFTEYFPYYNTTRPRSRFIHIKNGAIMEVESSLCLEAEDKITVRFRKCKHSLNQQWRFSLYTDSYQELMKGRTEWKYDLIQRLKAVFARS